MSNVILPIGLDLKQLQPQLQLGHGNSSHLASIPNTSHHTSSSSSKRTSSKPSKHHFYDDLPKIDPVSFGSAPSSVIDHEDSNDSATTGSYASYDIAHEYMHTSPFNQEWVCSQEFVQNRTPSRKDNILHDAEMTARRKGTCFIRQVANHLKLKPICKETAYIYFHRFYMLRSFKKYEPYRIGMACLYLACKFEDHPTFKEHLVRISYMFTNRKDLNKADKEYAEWCDRLIRDENLLLQVLGFTLQIRHFQVLIVEASQNPIEGTSKELYTTAYKISSEINRLTMLCVEYPSPILSCVAIYLAAIYLGVALPDDWCASVKGATVNDLNLVFRIGEEHKERIAKDSDLVRGILKDSGVKCLKLPNAYCSPGYNSRGSTPSHSFFGRNDHLTSQILTTFSPDSAYSSNSSHSPPDNGNYSSHSSRNPTLSHNNIYNNHMINHQTQKSSQQLPVPAAAFSPTAAISNSYDLSKILKRAPSKVSSHQVGKNSLLQGVAVQSNTQSSSILASFNGSNNTNKKRPMSSNHNSVDSFYASSGAKELTNSNALMMMTTGGSETNRKRLKSDHHSTGSSGSKHQMLSGHMYSSNSNKVNITNNNGNRMMNINNNAALSFINQQQTSSNNYTSMPHF